MRMCKAIRFKRATVSQLIYLNNSVLLPSIEYRLQTSFLTKSKCDRIQKPIWILIKNKLELARSVANSICSHIGQLNLRSIWQNQLAHHITELTLQLNQENEIGTTTHLRLKDTQLKSKSKFSLLDSRCNTKTSYMKNNLAYNVIYGIAKLGFNFQETLADTNNLEIEGPEISSLLEGKALKNFLDNKNCYIFTLDQLLVKEGDKLLSW